MSSSSSSSPVSVSIATRSPSELDAKYFTPKVEPSRDRWEV